MAAEEPKIRIDDREELIYLLAEAASIEHNVMCCYLYAAWSLKRGERDGLTPDEAAAVKRWKDAIFSVAIEEMTHLTLAGNLSCAIGGAPHLSHPNYPVPPGYHPSGLIVELAGFSHDVLDHFIFIERPEGKELEDSSEFVHFKEYHRAQPRGRIMPSAQDYATVGHLYRAIRHGFERLAHHLGEDQLFCGDPAAQIGPGEAPLPGLSLVTDLDSAYEAIETIIEQGEGAPQHSEDSHYQRFLDVRADYEKLLQENPGFEPAWPVAHNPIMRNDVDSHGHVLIDNPEAARVVDLANAAYGHMLRCLVQAWGRHADDQRHKRMLVDVARELMGTVDKMGEHLASLPASKRHHKGVHAGVTFTMLRDIQRVPTGPAEMRMMAERLVELADQTARVFPDGHELSSLRDKFSELAERFDVPDGKAAAPEPTPQHHDVPIKDADVECAVGKELTINFDGARCIHARHCVLGAPSVFKANTPGEWIFPDTMPGEELAHVAKNCPSGAITYESNTDAIANEHAPPVNTIHLRENGPYTVHADIVLRGAPIGFRATLCRCGASKNKPFCDGSHVEIGFNATGEPDSRPSEPLEVRDGELKIDPEPNGPLVVSGNVEICAGTGRTIDRVTGARLCRCGGSRNKPFCDNTHRKIGFEAD